MRQRSTKKVEYVKVQLSIENIEYIKSKGSFANIINKLLDKESNIGIIGSKLLFYYKSDTLQAIGGKFNKYTAYFGEIGKNTKDLVSKNLEYSFASYAIGASMMVPRRYVENVGLLYEGYFLYYEEIDWSERGRQKNYTTAICQSSIVYHKEGGSTQQNKKLNLKIEYFKYKNLIIFYNHFYKYLVPIAYFRLVIKMSKKVFKGQFDEAKLILKVILKIKP
jgi:GT2 family glycosyltransferase